MAVNPNLDETHDPELTSWVESANKTGCDFPIQNLPFGIFKRRKGLDSPHAGIAIGDRILDLAVCLREGLLEGEAGRSAHACMGTSLNAFMEMGTAARRALRLEVSRLLRADSVVDEGTRERILISMGDAEMFLPAVIRDYTDFYASIHHATNVGSMFRPDNPLLPNYKWIPIGYHGRASSIVVSGTPVRRPCGQILAPESDVPARGPSRLLDYEGEVGFFVSHGNRLGETIPIQEAEDHLFGLCLVNDWSARDIQKWEYQPLGPFLAKSFATSLSPWIVTLEALAPFRVPSFKRAGGDPSPLAYLDDGDDRESGGIDLQVEVYLATESMRREGREPVLLSRAPFKEMYWTIAQMLTHHAGNGCNLQSGDLLASGTVSGPERGSRGSLLELTWRGSEPLKLSGGETRIFLQDGDEVIMRGFCAARNAVRIGFGECRGIVQPAFE